MITILTLFAGRYYVLEEYLWGLSNLDWNLKDIKLIWYCNSEKKMFQRILKEYGKEFKNKFHSVEIIIDTSIPTSGLALKRKSSDIPVHLDNIPQLYNKAFAYVDTDLVLSWEDDEVLPSHCIKRFVKDMEYADVKNVTGIVFGRHGERLIPKDIIRRRVYPENDTCKEFAITVIPPKYTFGVWEIGMTGLGCNMLKMDFIKNYTFKQTSNESENSLTGCDLVMSYDIIKAGFKNLIDWDVRVLHYAPDGEIY